MGAGAGFSFTVTADVILSSVPPARAGAASAVSETAYELGAALGIAVLGSIVMGGHDFTAGLRSASAVGAAVLLCGAATAWHLLRGQRLADGR